MDKGLSFVEDTLLARKREGGISKTVQSREASRTYVLSLEVSKL